MTIQNHSLTCFISFIHIIYCDKPNDKPTIGGCVFLCKFIAIFLCIYGNFVYVLYYIIAYQYWLYKRMDGCGWLWIMNKS